MKQRKKVRLESYDYDTPGHYFITICVKNKQKLLGEVVGTGLLDGPRVEYTAVGEAVREQLDFMSEFYEDIKLEQYVIMPNHVHVMLELLENRKSQATAQNSRISKWVGTFKRFTNRKTGMDLWQVRSHDHVVRDERDYLIRSRYIQENPAKWIQDREYVE